jgi:hypothetical protein
MGFEGHCDEIIRHPSSLFKRLLFVIVRTFVYTVIFVVVQTKHLVFSENCRSASRPVSTNLRMITNDSPVE